MALESLFNGLTSPRESTSISRASSFTGTNKLGVGLLLQGSVGSVHNGRIQNFNVGIKSDGAISDWAIGIPNALSVHNNRTGGVPVDVENREAIFRHSVDRRSRPTPP